jgi:two-component system phosphate regulon sensor histidine kinase PhoR
MNRFSLKLLLAAVALAIVAEALAAMALRVEWRAPAVGVTMAIGTTFATIALIRSALRRLDTAAAGGTRRMPIALQGDIGELGAFIQGMADDADRTVRALVRERVLLGSVLDGLSHGVIAVDGERKITLINQAARELFDVPGVPIGEAFAEQIRLGELVERVEQARGAESCEVLTERGARIAVGITPLRDEDGGLLVVLEDITTMRRLETIRRDFVANVSHELRTPVSVIRANAETLLAGAKDEPRIADRLIDGLHRNAERLAHIVNDLLEISRLEAGEYRVARAPVEVAGIAQQVAALIEPNATKRNVSIEVRVPAELSAVGDSGAIEQVLVNLIDNAVKYTSTGGHVRVSGAERGERVRIEVADDGPGIAAEHRERIFERFYRVDPGRSREVGGTGLGLSIVKHLVETMGGAVGVACNEPQGSVFWIELPRAT